MYFERTIQSYLLDMAKKYPVITVTGPRQSGKTTVVQATFPDKPYVNLESLQTRAMVEKDPVGFLDDYPKGAIIDEIQCYPALLSEIQVRVDASKQAGQYILTGSHQLGMQEAVVQSLAGRTAIARLLPMSVHELTHASLKMDTDTLLYQGGFPRIYSDGIRPELVYDHYVYTYLERDLRQMINVKDLGLFQKFIGLCAGRIGQLFNKDALASEVGVSAKTIAQWLSILEASYIVFLLPPYHENFGKRVIKSPKLYFCDVGLASFLLDIESSGQMKRDPLRGALFENLVILELIKARWNQGLRHRLHFYRDAKQNEVDVLFKSGHALQPIEIKSAKTFHGSFSKGIDYFRALVGDRAINPHIIYAGAQIQKLDGIQLLHYTDAYKALAGSGKD